MGNHEAAGVTVLENSFLWAWKKIGFQKPNLFVWCFSSILHIWFEKKITGFCNFCHQSSVYLKNFHDSSDICPMGFIYSIQICEISHQTFGPGGCFTNVSRALQDILSKFVYCRNHTSDENFKLKLCTCAQNHALGTHTKFQLEILTINVISGIVYICKIILERSRNVSETTPRPSEMSDDFHEHWNFHHYWSCYLCFPWCNLGHRLTAPQQTGCI